MKLLHRLPFRLMLTYTAVFVGSVFALMLLYYWLSVARPMNQARGIIRAEASEMLRVYREGGQSALVPALNARARKPARYRAYHALLAADGHAVTTNLPSWPRVRDGEWRRIEADVYYDGFENDYTALVYDMALPAGQRLLIGRDVDPLDDLEESLLGGAAWLLAGILILSIGGSAVMARAIGGRVDSIDQLARSVIAGDMSGRIPVRGSGDDFDRLSVTLNLMLTRIEELMGSVRRVSDSVAHELRTPLARLQADLADIDSAAGSPKSQLLRAAIGEAERLNNVFDAVLRISRLDAGQHDAQYSPVDLSILLTDAAEFYMPAAEAKGVALRLAVAPGARVSGDPNLLFQAVTNLLDNALKYTPGGGRIDAATSHIAHDVLLTITDSGPGIPPEHRAHVVERFYRVEKTAGAPGIGLGLSFVASVSRLHHAQLTFKDAAPGLAVEWRFTKAA